MFKKNSNITFLLICLTFIFAVLARGGVQGWAVTVIHMMTLAALTALLVQKSFAWDWIWIKTPLDLPIAALMVLAFFSLIFSANRPTSLWAVLLLFNYVIIFYLIIHTIRSRAKLRNFLWIILGTGIFLAVFGLIKFAGIEILSWFNYEDLPDFGALTSTYGNPNHIAGFFEMAIPVVFGLLLADRRGPRSLVLFLPIILLFGVALILSLSRGGWTCTMLGLIFFLGVLFFAKDFPRFRTVITVTCSFIVAVLVLLSSYPAVQELLTVRQVIEQAGGAEGRLQVSQAVVAMIREKPLLGFGPGTFAFTFFKFQPPAVSGWYNMAHNDYLHFTAEMGILLPVIMIWMIVALAWHGFIKLRSPSLLVRGATLGSMAGILAILCHSYIDFNLHIPANALFFTILAALIAAPAPKIKKFRKGKMKAKG